MKRNIFALLIAALMLVILLPACSPALLDQGLNVGWVDENYERVDVDPSMELEPNSYYTGGSIRLNDNIFAQISFVTEEEAIPLGEAVIARLEFYMHSEDDPAVLSKIEFDGVPVTELTRDVAEIRP